MPLNEQTLFPPDNIVGVFRGFSQGGLEFHADLILPYRNEFQRLPMHGQFILIQLETPQEGVLGRITSIFSAGRLASIGGEEFSIRAVQEQRTIPEELREQYLKYRVDIRVLGVMRLDPRHGPQFVPSHRRLPHVGSPVAFPTGEVIRELVGHHGEGAPLGHLAYGEYVYAAASDSFRPAPWMRLLEPETIIHFPVQSLVARRSFIFARAGFGKSNLNKLLFSQLYEGRPTVTKRGGREVPVGTILFDPDGEYFWPDDKGRPGLCDVPALRDQMVVFTPREAPSDYYRAFVVGGVKLDLRRFHASDVIAVTLSHERQAQQNVRKLAALSRTRWAELVTLIDQHGNQAPTADVRRLLDLDKGQEVEAIAARSNMTAIVRMLHDKSSQVIDKLMQALSDGKLCVVDVSQMRGGHSLALSALILRRIFERNQAEFTKAEPRTIPTIAVVEEAQSVLDERSPGAETYIAWVKEGRKYDLGAVLVTQQPGSIQSELLSQGDNWFIFHLLSAQDLRSLQTANAHFSEDILSSLLNEPIPGQGVFWSSVAGRPFPISLRVLSFESAYQVQDPTYSRAAEETYALQLRRQFNDLIDVVVPHAVRETPAGNGYQAAEEAEEPDELDAAPDVLAAFENRAIQAFKDNDYLISGLSKPFGVSWGKIKYFLRDKLPAEMDNRDEVAYNLVVKAMETVFGPQDKGWHSYRHIWDNGKGTTYIRLGSKPAEEPEAADGADEIG